MPTERFPTRSDSLLDLCYISAALPPSAASPLLLRDAIHSTISPQMPFLVAALSKRH